MKDEKKEKKWLARESMVLSLGVLVRNFFAPFITFYEWHSVLLFAFERIEPIDQFSRLFFVPPPFPRIMGRRDATHDLCYISIDDPIT